MPRGGRYGNPGSGSGKESSTSGENDPTDGEDPSPGPPTEGGSPSIPGGTDPGPADPADNPDRDDDDPADDPAASDPISRVVNIGSEVIDDVGSDVGDVLGDVRTGVQRRVTTVGSEAGETIDDVTTGVDRRVTRVRREIGDVTADVGSDAGETIDDVTTGVDRRIDDVRDEGNNIIDDVTTAGSETVGDVRAGIDDVTADVGGAVDDVTAGVNDFNNELAAGDLSGAGDIYSDTVSEPVGDVTAATNPAAQVEQEVFGTDRLASVSEGVGEGVAEIGNVPSNVAGGIALAETFDRASSRAADPVTIGGVQTGVFVPDLEGQRQNTQAAAGAAGAAAETAQESPFETSGQLIGGALGGFAAGRAATTAGRAARSAADDFDGSTTRAFFGDERAMAGGGGRRSIGDIDQKTIEKEVTAEEDVVDGLEDTETVGSTDTGNFWSDESLGRIIEDAAEETTEQQRRRDLSPRERAEERVPDADEFPGGQAARQQEIEELTERFRQEVDDTATTATGADTAVSGLGAVAAADAPGVEGELGGAGAFGSERQIRTVGGVTADDGTQTTDTTTTDTTTTTGDTTTDTTTGDTTTDTTTTTTTTTTVDPIEEQLQATAELGALEVQQTAEAEADPREQVATTVGAVAGLDADQTTTAALESPQDQLTEGVAIEQQVADVGLLAEPTTASPSLTATQPTAGGTLFDDDVTRVRARDRDGQDGEDEPRGLFGAFGDEIDSGISSGEEELEELGVDSGLGRGDPFSL